MNIAYKHNKPFQFRVWALNVLLNVAGVFMLIIIHVVLQTLCNSKQNFELNLSCANLSFHQPVITSRVMLIKVCGNFNTYKSIQTVFVYIFASVPQW